MSRGAGILFIAERPRSAALWMLLLLRSARVKNSNQWGIPGGSSERGETPWETALRETREEAGERAYRRAKRAKVVRQHTDPKGFTTFVVCIGRPFKPTLNWEHDDWAWVTPAETSYGRWTLHKGVASLMAKSNPSMWDDPFMLDVAANTKPFPPNHPSRRGWIPLYDYAVRQEKGGGYSIRRHTKKVTFRWAPAPPEGEVWDEVLWVPRKWMFPMGYGVPPKSNPTREHWQWKETIRDDGTVHSTVHWDSLDDFFYTIEKDAHEDGDPEGNKQVYDNWRKVGSNRYKTHYFDNTGGRWDLEFEWVRVKYKTRWNPRRKGLRATPWGSRRDMDLWTGERWQSSPMDMYPREDRFFQSAYKHYGPNGPCFGGFNQKEASDDLAPLLRKMYEDGKRKGTDMTVGRTRTNPAKKIKRLMELGFTREEALEAMDPWESPPRPRKKRAPTKRKKPRVTKDKDTYLPEEEQLRAQRQAIYETSLSRKLGKPFRDTRGKRLDAKVIRKEGPERLRPFMRNKMFAMGTGVQRRDARLKKGTQTPTKKTILESKARYSDVDKLTRNRQDYEESLGIARKSGFYRITKEPTKSGWEYFVWPLAPGERIPKGYKQRADAIRRATSLERDTNPIYSGKWWTPSKKKYTKRELSEWLPPESYWKKG